MPEVQSPQKARIAIVVLGMHRSGTSALTRMLNLLGAELPKNLMPSAPGNNDLGFWEPQQLISLHDRMMGEAGSYWRDWRIFDPTSLPPGRLDHYRAEITRIISEEYGDAPLIVLKDPRICRFVPLYETALADLGISPRYVLANRNPLAVIASLVKRDSMVPAYAGLLWLRHTIDAETATRGRPRVFLSYEDVLNDWRRAAELISKGLGIVWPRSPHEATSDIENHLTRDLQHHAPTLDDLMLDGSVSAWIKKTYEARLQLAISPESGEALSTLSNVAERFNEMSDVFGRAIFPTLRAAAEKAKEQSKAADQRLRSVTQKAEEQSRAANERLRCTTQKAEEQLRRLSEARDQLERNLRSTHELNLAQKRQIDAAHAELYAIQHSTSWKVTAPLRALRRTMA